jgi:hypothetical protein
MSNLTYFWLGLGLLLIAAETFLPGMFLLWFGLAALIMSGVAWLLPGLGALWQLVAFSVLAFLSAWAYRRYVRPIEPQGDQPLLNRRADQLVGRVVVLREAIVNGYGKVQIADALWTVHGHEDLPEGARVKVTAVDGMTLKVRQATD